MRQFWKRLHRGFGVFIAIYMAVMALTGTLLVYKEALISFVIPEIGQEIESYDTLLHADDVDEIEARYSEQGINSLRMPLADFVAYKLYLWDHSEVILNVETLMPVEDPFNIVGVFAFIFDVHHRLALGDTGEELMGVLGIVTLIILSSGLYLWWPWRKGFRFKALRPKSNNAAAYRGAHATIGIMVWPLLFVVVITGTSIMYFGQVRTILTSVLGGGKVVATEPLPVGVGRRNRYNFIVEKLHADFPEGKAVYYIPSRDGKDDFTVRFKMPEEWHPYGRSYVAVAFDRRIVRSYDAMQADLGHRITDKIYPLHAGKTGHSIWTLLLFLTGIFTMYLCSMGLSAYFRKKHGG